MSSQVSSQAVLLQSPNFCIILHYIDPAKYMPTEFKNEVVKEQRNQLTLIELPSLQDMKCIFVHNRNTFGIACFLN